MATDIEIDAAIISNISPHWQKVAMVAVKAIEQLQLASTEGLFDAVCRRIKVLADASQIEAQGNVTLPRHSEVRAKSRTDA
jgi:ribosomal protein S10